MRHIILDEINRAKLVLERIIWSKWPKIAIFAKKHIFSQKKCVLSVKFQTVSLNQDDIDVIY